MKLKIMEWNINQRMNYAGLDMPSWISDVILKEDADLVALTEVYKGNNWGSIKKKAFNSNYAVFETCNSSAGQNDVAIAVNVNKLEIIYSKAYYPCTIEIPDYLEVKCRNRGSDKEFAFVCVRIHALVDDKAKRKELEHVMSATKEEDTVIICGDFNNYRRGTEKQTWSLTQVGEICKANGFNVKTPDGSSIYTEKVAKKDYEFAEDHFLLKGIDETNFILHQYDRDFTENDERIYKWGRDFQSYLGKGHNKQNLYDSVPPPFPDHAILTGEVEI